MQLAVRPDQPGAAPERMRGRGEDRLVEMIFPIAGEFLLGDDARAHRLLAAAPPPAMTTGSPTEAVRALPSGSAGRSSGPSACTSANPL